MLIEALTVLFIFSLIVVTFFSVFSVGLRYIQDAKNRLSALSVANEKIEIIRNLFYDDIGTVSGTVSGNIPQDQTITENNHQFTVHTEVTYVDDSFDGIGFSDTVWFEDYKKVIVTVSWNNGGNTEKVELVSRFVPPGKEVPHIGDGILSVNVFSDQSGGVVVSGAKVAIKNLDTGIDTFGITDASGNVTFMGNTITDSIQKYQLTITKDDYETVATMPPYPDSVYNPVDVHASVVTGVMNVKNIAQNKLANIKIAVVDYLDQSIENAEFNLIGGRKLGTNAADPDISIYNFDEDGTTDSSGEKLFSSISPGVYTFSLIDSTLADYEIINFNPATIFSLLPEDGTLNVKAKLASKAATALLVTVVDNVGDLPIAGATVKLTNVALGYDKELLTASDGKAFFPDSSDPFLPETYHLKVTADGFSDKELDVTVTANNLKKEEIRLE